MICYSSWICCSTNILRHFSAFVIPIAGAPWRQRVTVFFLADQNEIQLFSGSSVLWHITKLVKRHSCCSQVFSSPICFLIFSVFIRAHIYTVLYAAQITRCVQSTARPTRLTDPTTFSFSRRMINIDIIQCDLFWAFPHA